MAKRIMILVYILIVLAISGSVKAMESKRFLMLTPHNMLVLVPR